MVNFLEAGQPELHASISLSLRRILLCRCAPASVRGNYVVGLEPELLSAPCRPSRSPRDLARTPEMHDG